ncbi:hypothetical protein TWF788_001738 [Orbilia oligospora]|uniref:Uncharacterized protein n=1 Tax=Orbilia oligospora TaxID=2813651 RepID=A0A6G1LVR5_ORBOL|nr:hypothetical protein TWF788_001738 [Orbilia oligospora]KAF3197381.1 hypothetical protein TWF679_003247 [Orbilia oligospora]KAF3235634.1 hypothetical protein TWF192_000662 [Orbilia oligospora]KAF3235635.1 hypothetical protein TWF192_000662 [Orbilia oligospora]
MCIEIEIDKVSTVSSSTTAVARRVSTKSKMSGSSDSTGRSSYRSPEQKKVSPQPIIVERASSTTRKSRTSILKRTPSRSPREDKTVKFAVDDYDRPLSPSEMHHHKQSPKVAGEPRKADLKDNLSGFPTNGCGHGDFTLFPSPLPSPPQSPLFVPLPSKAEEARLRARQQKLEEEINELTRRAVAREANHREQLRRRVVEFETSTREDHKRSREIDIEGSFSRRVAARRERSRSEDGSIDLSSSPRHSSPRPSKETKTFSARFSGAFSASHNPASFFPSPLPSPAVSQVRTTVHFEDSSSRPLSRRQSHSPTRRTQQMSLVPRGECYRPRSLDSITTPPSAQSFVSATLPPAASLLPPAPSVPTSSSISTSPRGRSITPTDNRARGRSPSPADSICAVVGGTDTEEELVLASDVEMSDSEDEEDNTSTTTSSAPCRDRRQCERCGLFGHELVECETPALDLSLRRNNRKREWEPGSPSLEGEVEGPPVKGLRHVKWMSFGNRA